MTERLHTPAAGLSRPSGGSNTGRDAFLTLHARDIQGYRLADDLSGALIVSMLIFSPWAFGTTQPWAIRCMNGAADALGLLLLGKLFLRHVKGCPAPRWDHFSPRSGTLSRRQPAAARRLNLILAWLTVAVLAECLLSAWNAAAYYSPETRVFHYKSHLEWLPHSFDGDRSWSCFWKYLGLAAAFWAVSDWLAGLTPAEERSLPGPANRLAWPPARLRTLLWVLAINGALLGLEGILQRESGTDKLLFVLQPRLNQGCDSQFAAYAYRSNAAQYFNLLWPVCLGFWWTLQRNAAGVTKTHHWLLPCTAIMAACPIIATTRAGALISAGMLLCVLVYLGLARLKRPSPAGQGLPARRVRSLRRTNPETLANPGLAHNLADHPAGQNPVPATGLLPAANPPAPVAFSAAPGNRESAGLLVLFVIVTLSLGGVLGWHSLAPRMELIGQGYADREAIYAAAEPMARDYPLFGTGPGTFGSVFQLYRYSEDTYWPEQVHDDWLETRITFGWLGFGLLLAALAATALRGFLPGGVRGMRPLVFFSWVALGGCLLHARFDFPFQIYSTLFMFLVICALLLNLGRDLEVSRS